MSPAVVFDSAGTLMKTVRAVFSAESGTVIPDIETTLLVFEDRDRSLVLLNAGNADIFAEDGDTPLSSWIAEKNITYAVSCGGVDMQTASAILEQEDRILLSHLQAAARVCRSEAEKESRLFAMNTGLILNTRLSAVEFLVAAAGYPFPGVKELIAFLREENVPVYIASGDRQEKLEAVAEFIGIEKSHVTGAATPEKKAEVVASLQEKEPVLMVGDGINDLAALRQADFSVLTLQQKGRRPDILFDAADAVIENICEVRDCPEVFVTEELPKIRGKEEEVLLRRILSNISAGGLSYVPGSSLYFPTNSGVTEADAVFLHESGVYVFECKHMTGAVSGKLRDRMWTKTGDGRVLSFPNPVLQNRRHAEAASAFFGVRQEDCISCVVFNDACDISRIEAGDARIWKTGEVSARLSPLLKRRVFSAAELERMILKAKRAEASVDKYAETHAAGIREAKQRKKAEKKGRS